jgi:hypothetical protein
LAHRQQAAVVGVEQEQQPEQQPQRRRRHGDGPQEVGKNPVEHHRGQARGDARAVLGRVRSMRRRKRLDPGNSD